MKKGLKILSVVTFLFGTTFLNGQSFDIDSKLSPVKFSAIGKPGFLKINGEGAQLAGSFQIDKTIFNGTFDLELKNFKTGIDLRDQHMHEKYLEVAKYPKATLKLETINLSNNDKYSGDFKGSLTIKDTTKPVTGKIDATKKGSLITGSANFEVTLDDYPSIGVPSWLGVTVAKNVKVEVKFSALEKPTTPAKIATVEKPTTPTKVSITEKPSKPSKVTTPKK